MKRGMWYAAGAYIAWGLLPIFWRSLHTLPALEILAHRVAWGFVVGVILVSARGGWGWLPGVLRTPRTLLTFVATAVLLSFNWFVFIWAVNAGYIVETSLGYFINPLVNVLLGRIFLNERLRGGQALAIGVALLGVLYLTVQYGSLPWIALALASSFAGYGLLRKTAALGSLEGYTLESIILFLPALGYLLYLESQGAGAYGHAGLGMTILLSCAGVVTAVPLLMFAAGARRISFTLLGILQYIAPSMQFTLGVLVYGEHLDTARLIGFCIIWAALALYTFEGIRNAAGAARLRAAAG